MIIIFGLVSVALHSASSVDRSDDLEAARHQIAIEILETWLPSPYGFPYGTDAAAHYEYGPRRRVSNAVSGEFRYDEFIRVCSEPGECEWQLRSRWLDDAADELNRLSNEYLDSTDVAEWVENGTRLTLADRNMSIISAMPSMVFEFDQQLRLTLQRSAYLESSCPSLAQWQARWHQFREDSSIENQFERSANQSTSGAGSYVEMVIPEPSVGGLRVNTSMVAWTLDEAERVWQAIVGDLSECESEGISK